MLLCASVVVRGPGDVGQPERCCCGHNRELHKDLERRVVDDADARRITSQLYGLEEKKQQQGSGGGVEEAKQPEKSGSS